MHPSPRALYVARVREISGYDPRFIEEDLPYVVGLHYTALWWEKRGYWPLRPIATRPGPLDVRL